MTTFLAIIGIYFLIGFVFAGVLAWLDDGGDSSLFYFAITPFWPVFAAIELREFFRERKRQ